MAESVVIEERNGFKLSHQENKDQYLRTLHSLYVITDPNGRKIGSVFTDKNKALEMFNRITADAST